MRIRDVSGKNRKRPGENGYRERLVGRHASASDANRLDNPLERADAARTPRRSLCLTNHSKARCGPPSLSSFLDQTIPLNAQMLPGLHAVVHVQSNSNESSGHLTQRQATAVAPLERVAATKDAITVGRSNGLLTEGSVDLNRTPGRNWMKLIKSSNQPRATQSAELNRASIKSPTAAASSTILLTQPFEVPNQILIDSFGLPPIALPLIYPPNSHGAAFRGQGSHAANDPRHRPRTVRPLYQAGPRGGLAGTSPPYGEGCWGASPPPPRCGTPLQVIPCRRRCRPLCAAPGPAAAAELSRDPDVAAASDPDTSFQFCISRGKRMILAYPPPPPGSIGDANATTSRKFAAAGLLPEEIIETGFCIGCLSVYQGGRGPIHISLLWNK
jgi:hypothetical protein